MTPCSAVARERAAAVIADVDHDPRGLVGERDFGGRASRVAHDVGQRFLDDAVRRQVDGGGKRARRTEDRRLGRHAGLAGRLHQDVELRQPRRGTARFDVIHLSQDLENSSQFAQCLFAGLFDGEQRLARLLRPLAHHVRGHARLHIDG